MGLGPRRVWRGLSTLAYRGRSPRPGDGGLEDLAALGCRVPARGHQCRDSPGTARRTGATRGNPVACRRPDGGETRRPDQTVRCLENCGGRVACEVVGYGAGGIAV